MAEIIRSVRPDEHQAVLDFWPTVFTGYSREFYAQYYNRDPWQNDEYTRIVELDGKIVAAVQLCKRPVNSPFGELVMGGIANVATLVEYRGKGYSSRLLLSCVEIMEREHFDFSVLYTGINDFYARLGWTTVPCGLIKGTVVLTRPASEVLLRIEDTPPPVEDLSSVYDAFNANRPIANVRTPAYWNWVLGRLNGCQWLTIHDSNRLAAYAAIACEKARLNVREIGWLPGCDHLVPDLARGIADQAVKNRLGEFFAIAPSEPVFLESLRNAGIDAVQASYRSAMFRCINMDKNNFDTLCSLMDNPSSIIWSADHF